MPGAFHDAAPHGFLVLGHQAGPISHGIGDTHRAGAAGLTSWPQGRQSRIFPSRALIVCARSIRRLLAERRCRATRLSRSTSGPGGVSTLLVSFDGEARFKARNLGSLTIAGNAAPRDLKPSGGSSTDPTRSRRFGFATKSLLAALKPSPTPKFASTRSRGIPDRRSRTRTHLRRTKGNG